MTRIYKPKLRIRHLREIFIYTMVGASAWLVQSLIFILNLEFKVYPSIAMILGNFMGMIISYCGHITFTFKNQRFSRRGLIKFTITSLIGLSINVLGVRLITKILLLNPHFAIIPTLFTPLITFLISKFWVFK